MQSITFTTKEEFDRVFGREVLDPALHKNLGIKLDKKEIEILCKAIDPDPNGCWDGEMVIKWAKMPKSQDVINHIISWANADEITMPTAKSLRLWWD